MKKILSLLTAIILFASLANTTFGTSLIKAFPDVVSGQTKYYSAIAFLKDEGVIEGYSDGNYKPEKLLNRAEFLKILISIAPSEGGFDTYKSKACFTDVQADQWYTGYICYAKEYGVISGYEDGNFKPEQPINLVEALKITLKAFGYEYKESNTWYKGLVDTASSINIIPPDFTSFSQKVNRGQMAELATRINKYGLNKLDEFLSDEYLGLKYPTVTYNTLEEGIDVEGKDETPQTNLKDCESKTDVTYGDHDFAECYIREVNSDKVLVFSGGISRSGYNLIPTDDPENIINSEEKLKEYWGEITSLYDAIEFTKAAKGLMEVNSEDDLMAMAGSADKLEKTDDFKNIKYSNESYKINDTSYKVYLFYSAIFGCLSYPISEYTFTVNKDGTIVEEGDSLHVANKKSGYCTD